MENRKDAVEYSLDPCPSGNLDDHLAGFRFSERNESGWGLISGSFGCPDCGICRSDRGSVRYGPSAPPGRFHCRPATSAAASIAFGASPLEGLHFNPWVMIPALEAKKCANADFRRKLPGAHPSFGMSTRQSRCRMQQGRGFVVIIFPYSGSCSPIPSL